MRETEKKKIELDWSGLAWAGRGQPKTAAFAFFLPSSSSTLEEKMELAPEGMRKEELEVVSSFPSSGLYTTTVLHFHLAFLEPQI